MDERSRMLSDRWNAVLHQVTDLWCRGLWEGRGSRLLLDQRVLSGGYQHHATAVSHAKENDAMMISQGIRCYARSIIPRSRTTLVDGVRS